MSHVISERMISVEVRSSVNKVGKSVPNPWFGQDVGGSRRIIFDLLAKSPDKRSQVIELRPILRSPDGTQQLRVSNRDPPIPHE